MMKANRSLALLLLGWGLVARPAHACAWDDEVYEAEEKTLPCLTAALTGSFPIHAPTYYEARLRAAEAALAVDPLSPWALDMAGVALLKLGRFVEAQAKMSARLAAYPDAYASHANLGTLHTFTGNFDRAREHIDRAMAIEPKAHFGREKYHRLLVGYLASGKTDGNFLGLDVTDADRTAGTPAHFDERAKAAGIGRDVFDALDAMITVYGAAEVPQVYAAAGDMLALFGSHAYATLAYDAAIAKKHPAAASLRKARAVVAARLTKRADSDEQPHSHQEYRWIKANPAQAGVPDIRAQYTSFERKELASGLAVWTRAGVAKLYAEQDRLQARCATGRVLEPAIRADTVAH